MKIMRVRVKLWWCAVELLNCSEGRRDGGTSGGLEWQRVV